MGRRQVRAEVLRRRTPLCFYVRVHESGDWDLFPWNNPLEWAGVETGIPDGGVF